MLCDTFGRGSVRAKSSHGGRLHMIRDIIFGQDETKERTYGSVLLVSNSGSVVKATLSNRMGREIQRWDSLDSVELWDVSITRILTRSSIELKVVFPRLLLVQYDANENILKVFEIEPGAVVPP
jgi:hypothetical protein